jgi:hypothetical protein
MNKALSAEVGATWDKPTGTNDVECIERAARRADAPRPAGALK